MTNATLDQLTILAAMGMRLHPLLAKNKVPILKDWQVKATVDPGMIRQWFSIHPHCNWGLATGNDSNVFVVDIDVKAHGDKTWAKLTKENKVPETIQVKTGGGGMHYYFKCPKTIDIRNSASKVGKGIDIRGNGGQVVIPPSIHPNGASYIWVDGHSPTDLNPAKAPKWLLDLIKANQGAGAVAVVGGPVEKGERNDAIYSNALSAAKQGQEKSYVLSSMIEWMRTQGEDIVEQEIEDTVNSAFKYYDNWKANNFNSSMNLNDFGNAQRLILRAQDNIRYVQDGIGWVVWDGKCWKLDLEDLAIQYYALQSAIAFEEQLKSELAATTDRNAANVIYKKLQFAISSQNIAKLKATTDMAKTFPEVQLVPSQLDDDRTTYLLNCENGILDLITLELKPHDKSLYITKLAPTAYDPKAKCPTFLQTLNYAFNKDKVMIAFLKRALGYSISGSVNEQCFFICYGPSGANGKSTILEAVHTVLGEGVYAKTSSAEAITSSGKSQQSGTSQSSLAALRKIRFASVNEFSASANLDEELLKRLTGGDMVEARYMYKEVFTYEPCFKIWIRANNEPNIKEVGQAFWRRLVELPFNGQIPEEKRIGPTAIRKVLKAETAGILNWLVEGFQDWHKNGLQKPELVKAAVMQYKKDSDVFEQFMGECVTFNPNTYVSRKTLYMAFRQWCEEQGIRYVMTHDKFSRGIADKLDQHKIFKQGVVPVWRGIELSPEAGMAGMLQ